MEYLVTKRYYFDNKWLKKVSKRLKTACKKGLSIIRGGVSR